MKLHVGKSVDDCLPVGEYETRQKFLIVNTNKPKGPDGLMGKF